MLGAARSIGRSARRRSAARSSCSRRTQRCRRCGLSSRVAAMSRRSGKIDVMDLRIAHLYPDLMSIYGDRGNVLALAQRARWRDIGVEVRTFTAGQSFDADWPDLWFFGGGQDQGQDIVGADLAGANGEALKASLASGAAALTVCGGYQRLGNEYKPEKPPAIPRPGGPEFPTRARAVRFVGNRAVGTPSGGAAGLR